MSKIKWDEDGTRIYETGVDRGVLYLPTDGVYSKGVAWNGLTAVTESPSGAEETALYADNSKYLSLRSVEEFGATIEAYTYPDEFGTCDGSVELVKGVSIGQQKRHSFGLSYRTLIGNDEVGEDFGYKIHLVYGATASPSEKARNTINDSPEATTMSWELTTVPVKVSGMKPTAHLIVDSRTADATKLAAFEAILYGADATPATEARLPLPDEVKTLMTTGA